MSWAGDPVPYRDLSDAGAGFFGPGREDAAPPGLTSVRLGLIGPAKRPAGRRLREGVALAVSEANARGGYNGLPYEVVYRADDGPWGMGAKQVTALAYEDSVWAILGGLEGGDAHLAELVAAKLWVPVVAPAAADLSIDYANVPWVFRCFPSDDRQARALLAYAQRRGYEGLVVFSEADREGRTGLRRLETAARRARISFVHREYVSHTPETAVAAGDIRDADAVLIWGRSESGLALLRSIRKAGFAGPALGPACLLSPGLTDGDPGAMVVAAPYDLSRGDAAVRGFRERYRKRTGRDPDAVALFAYDAARLVISAVERAGLNRARIRDALAGIAFEGIVGTYRFDGLGGTSLEPVVMALKDGKWTRIGD